MVLLGTVDFSTDRTYLSIDLTYLSTDLAAGLC